MRYFKQVLALSVGAMVLVASGCASIVHQTRQQVSFSSTPPGCSVTVNGISRGTAPLTVDLKRKGPKGEKRKAPEYEDAKDHVVLIELEGFEPMEIVLERKFSGWYWGNFVFGGVVGLVVDAVNGAMFKIQPKEVMAMMNEMNGGEDETSLLYESGEDILYIAVVLRPEPGWEKIGSLKRASTE